MPTSPPDAEGSCASFAFPWHQLVDSGIHHGKPDSLQPSALQPALLGIVELPGARDHEALEGQARARRSVPRMCLSV